jgi:hypothetical protein
MIDAIVTSLDKEKLLVTPNSDVELGTLVGKRVRYRDNSDKIWTGKVTGVEDTYVLVAFDKFPSGLGQGQILQILDEGEPEDME